MSFASFELHSLLQAGVKAAGYTEPTPIQREAIPAVMAGKDVLGLARTGTGKTASFVLPMLNRLLGGARGRIRALIVAPTRELAEQIDADIRMLGAGTGLRSATVYGGVGKAPQIRSLRGKAEIIVACPGRLLDHLRSGVGDLSAVEVLVLDEADHMFDMGFLPDVRSIVGKVPKKAQRLLFSATMPADLRKLASAILTDPVTVEFGPSAPVETVEHALYPVAQGDKIGLLKHLLDTPEMRSALVFTRTKRGAKRLAERLDGGTHRVTSLQGNLSQGQRQRALDGFRDGRFNVLVATDIAARGLDVSRVSHVINFDIPSTGDAYTHRIGRTGRAERSGEAYTLVTGDDEKAIRSIERELGMKLDRVVIDGFGGNTVQNSSSNGQGAGRNGGGNGQRPDRNRGGRGTGSPSHTKGASRGADRGGAGDGGNRDGSRGSGRGSSGNRRRGGRPNRSRSGQGGGQDGGNSVRNRGE